MTKALYWSVCWLPMVLCLVHKGYVKSCGLMIGLLSMYDVMGLHMYIALVDLDLDYE